MSWWISTRGPENATSWFRWSASNRIHPSTAILFFFVLGAALLLWPVAGEQACEVHVGDQEFSFPLDRMERQALCRLAGVVNDPTTSHVNPPVLTPIPKAVYDFLLDHMVLTAALVRQLALGDYRVQSAGAQGFHGMDSQGSEGLFDLLYQGPTQRVYHIQGRHHGKVFLLITGEAVVMLTSQTRNSHDGKESVETRMALYSRLDNPMLATLVKVLQPILRGVINEKLAGPFLALHRLGELIAADPKEVYRQAETASGLDKAELDALHALLLPSLTPPRP